MRISFTFASLIRWINAELSAFQISLAGAAMDQSNGLTGPALEDGSIVMMFPVDGVGVRVGIGVEGDVTGGIAVGEGARVGIGVEDDVTGGIAVGDAARVGIGVGEETNPIKPIESIYNVPWLRVRL